MSNEILENELNIPENWETNTVLIKNKDGNIVELIVPDDNEEG